MAYGSVRGSVSENRANLELWLPIGQEHVEELCKTCWIRVPVS